MHDTVEIYLDTPQFTSFTLFSWMTNNEGPCQWVTGDSVQGKLHSNGSIAINGSPVFMDKVTTAHKFSPSPGKGTDQAIFNKGYETGVDSVFFPTDLTSVFNIANTSSGRFYNTPSIWVTLNGGNSAVAGDGTALVRTSKNGPVIDTVHITSSAGFTGVIMGNDSVHVQGTIDGQVTVASNQGNIYVEDNLQYERDPRFYSTSKDMLGLVAEQSVIVADNAANQADCTIQGNIFARTGSLTAQNYDNGVLRGRLSILGSIVQNVRAPVGTNMNGVLNSGYFKSYAYDSRLYDPNVRPPYYPGFIPSTVNITGWWESLRLPNFANMEQ
jgi:cytoskeletal protein CcmA (bactofilin family)